MLDPESVPRRGNYGARDFVYYDGPNQYSELSNRGYDPRDFEDVEDAQRRGVAVAIYGGIILAGSLLVSQGDGTSVVGNVGAAFALALVGALIAGFLAPLLLKFLGGEAALAGFLSGLTLFSIAIAALVYPTAPWFGFQILMLMIGGAFFPIGLILALEARREADALDRATPTLSV